MKISKISQQVKRPDRYSVYVDEKYEFSLHEQQLAESGIRVGHELTVNQLADYKNESLFGKAYERVLKYIYIRPRSRREIVEYLTRIYMYPKPKIYTDKDGNLVVVKQTADKPVISQLINRLMERLEAKGYINDAAFARAWVESRQLTKRTSVRRLQQELQAKSVDQDIIATVLQNLVTTDMDNLREIIIKKQRISRYKDPKKLILYLQRQGYKYSDIVTALEAIETD